MKNETRNLQKEINNLEANISLIKYDLDQAFLDHEIITSPENISLLAKKHLNIELTPYKKSQIKRLDDKNEELVKVNKQIKEKTKIQQIKKLYSQPETIPAEIKNQVTKRVAKKKEEIIDIYKAPKNAITLEKAGRWGMVQLVKAFLGMPIIPGR